MIIDLILMAAYAPIVYWDYRDRKYRWFGGGMFVTGALFATFLVDLGRGRLW